MKLRGKRECQTCGCRWSYYDTGEVTCPSCGSLRSVGVDDRSLHTATPATFDLAPVRAAIDEGVRELADRAVSRCREFTRGYGFLDDGTLAELEETYLAAMELRSVAGELARRMAVDDDEEYYFYELLGADEGDRPDADIVPESLRAMRGLAYANAVREYRADIRRYLEEHPHPAARRPFERLGDHVARIRALDGDVPPREAESVVAAARDLGRYLRTGDETALADTESRLDGLL